MIEGNYTVEEKVNWLQGIRAATELKMFEEIRNNPDCLITRLKAKETFMCLYAPLFR